MRSIVHAARPLRLSRSPVLRSFRRRASRTHRADQRHLPTPSGRPTARPGEPLATRPLDQITTATSSKLQIAWRLKTDCFGPRPDTLYSATPLFVDNVLYTTAGMRAPWSPSIPRRARCSGSTPRTKGRAARTRARSGAGRGVAYWSSADGSDRRDHLRHARLPDDRARREDRERPCQRSGKSGVVDLKLENDQELDLDTADLGLNATPLVAGDVIVVGAAQRSSGSPQDDEQRAKATSAATTCGPASGCGSSTPSPSRASSATTRGWRHSAERQRQHRRVGADQRRPRARSRLRARGDADGRLLRRQPAGQHAVRRQSGRARHQDREAQVALPDGAPRRLGLGPAVRADAVRHRPSTAGGSRRWRSRPSRRSCSCSIVRPGEPIWPIEERPVPQSDGAEGADQPDAAVPDQAGAVRSAGRVDRRSDRLHAGAHAPRRSTW